MLVSLQWAFPVSSFSLCACRKKSLLLNNLFVVLAALLAGCSRRAKSLEMIMLSRFLAGVNSGG